MLRPLASALAVVVFLASACGAPDTPAPGELVMSKQHRLTSPAPQADLDQAVRDATEFSLAVFRRLPAGTNTAFSPQSVLLALAMTSAGASGDTLAAFEHTLHPSLPSDRFHRAMNDLDAQLRSRGHGAQAKDGRPFALRINNQLFGQKGQAFQAPFLDLLAQEYGAGMRLLDFAGQSEASRQAINGWIDTNTEHLVPELLAPGSVTADTRLALVNTLYFNAGWKTKFDHAATQPAAFTRDDGSVVQVPMMQGEGVVSAAATVDGVEVVELPYSGDEVSLVLLVPPQGKLATFEHDLDASKLSALVAALQPSSQALHLPRFTARTHASLGDVLQALGLGVAFSAQADFSAMTGARELFIQSVTHEAVVKTDEDGTEAAAATAVLMGKTSLPQFIEVNRPFVYLVRDRATGALLFVGHVGDPS